ncbi:MAG: acyl-coenzyme A thioesterase PaaI-like protein [Psychromonas sp.]|jgi:acyl-coenzyme A thioesterase PaaI-like protein
MEYNNGLNHNISRLKSFPSFLRPWLLDKTLGKTVKYVGTSGVHFEKMTCQEVVVSLGNSRKVQNHIHQLHAAATTLLAETATGMVVGMNIPDDKIPLMKNLSVKFIKRSLGAQTAVASLSKEQINTIRTTEKGELSVPVKVTDETGEEVIIAEMNWAWIPKNK